MALDTRLIGRALGLANPVDIGKALDPAIEKGERRFAEQRARREREQVRARKEQMRQEDNTAKSISLLSNINEAGVAPNLRSYISKNAQIIRNEAIEKIKAAKTPAEKIAATMEANQKIGTLAAQSSDFNKYLQNFADLKPEDISKLNQEGIGEQATNILDGNFKITDDGKFDFGNGRIVDFNQVVNTNYINKRSDKYLELLKIADNTASKFGLQGVSNEFFKDKLKGQLSTVEMSDLDLMSVAVDHFGIEDFKEVALDKIGGSLIERVKEDFDADGDIDDVALRTQLREAINSRIQAASESVYSKAKAEYDKKIKISTSTRGGSKQALAADRAMRLYKAAINNPSVLIKEISSGQEFTKKGNTVQMQSRDDDNNIVDNQAYNLSTPEGLKGFLADFGRAKYGSDADFDLIQDEFDRLIEATKFPEDPQFEAFDALDAVDPKEFN
tara:strand:- start:11344 stop:12678 length:1335 start_codon:yes stop_codon:yes gene_type:complete